MEISPIYHRDLFQMAELINRFENLFNIFLRSTNLNSAFENYSTKMQTVYPTMVQPMMMVAQQPGNAVQGAFKNGLFDCFADPSSSS